MAAAAIILTSKFPACLPIGMDGNFITCMDLFSAFISSFLCSNHLIFALLPLQGLGDGKKKAIPPEENGSL